MYCSKCGKEIMDEAVICPGCGCAVQGKQIPQNTNVDETISGGLVLLSILIPLFGIIYWPVKAKERPKCAKVCGIAGIVSWAISFVLIMSMGGF